jgi:hypothetical protein
MSRHVVPDETEPDLLRVVVTRGVVIKLFLAHWSGRPDTRIEQTRSVATGTGVTVGFRAVSGDARYEPLPRA